jgi:hypothetical protein
MEEDKKDAQAKKPSSKKKSPKDLDHHGAKWWKTLTH